DRAPHFGVARFLTRPPSAKTVVAIGSETSGAQAESQRFRGFTMSPRFVAHMLSGHLAKLTKETLLNSPAFHRFAQESSSIAQKALNEAMRAAQPVVDKAASRSQQTLRQLERKANESLKNK
ncbi:unnamed protein product, partial [Effrenium voratum]